jgi:hypothetical protein
MKITDYGEVSSLSASNVLLADGSDGTKKVTAQNAANSVIDLADDAGKIDVLAGRCLPLINLLSKNTVADLKADIAAGTFKKAVVGGYVEINNRRYYMAHPDYWYNCGDTAFTTHHMLVVPATAINNGQMHKTDSGQYESGAANTTEGGYFGSDMRGEEGGLATATATIKADMEALGFSVLTHREYFTNAVTDGRPSAGAWYNSDVDLMNENMVYGCNVFTSHSDGTNIPTLYTIDKSQLKLFSERPDLITTRAGWWLRDVVSSAGFARVAGGGAATCGSASDPLGVRPAFAIA